jgi:hypothetical protein
MSTKTLRKRIALVAVATLGAGVLSVAPANATTLFADIDPNTYDYTATGSVGICKAPVNTAAASAGTAHDSTKNATQATGEVLAGGTVAFAVVETDTLVATGDQVTISVSGGTIGSATAAQNPVYAPGFTALAQVNSTNSGAAIATAFTVKAPSTPGVMQVTITKNALAASATTVEIYTITVSSACVTGSFSATNSLVKVSYLTNVATSSAPTVNTTDAAAATASSVAESAAKIANGGIGYVAVRIMDGQSTPVNVTSAGVFGATATNGAVIGWDLSSTLQSSSSVEAVAAGAQFNTLGVFQGTANKDKPMSTVITITYNGTVIGTRTITFTGKASAITIDSANAGIGEADTANVNVATYEITDAAGNKLTSEGPGISGISGAAGEATNVPVRATSGVVVDSVNQSLVTAALSDNGTEGNGVNGYFGWTCGANAVGTAAIYLKYTASDLSSLVSNTHNAACGGSAVNYKASLDKASYAPGEIATLTITATDSKGKSVFDADDSQVAVGVVLGSAGTSTTLSITLPQLTAVSTPTNSDTFSGGKKTYKFTVGTTEGTFAGVVDLPAYNSTTYSQSALTLSYKVAAATGAVSNADVLKAIVSLIASINKQIAALQKALLRR